MYRMGACRWLVLVLLPGCTVILPYDIGLYGDDRIGRDASSDEPLGVEGDSPSDGADHEGDRDAEERTPGPLTLVFNEGAFLQDRLCDLDGDGARDNAIADLGEPASSLLALALGTLVEGNFEKGSRLGVHIPWVDLQRDDEVLLIFFEGMDEDMPPDPSDDFTGHEMFYVKASSVDACGEPRGITRGSVDASLVSTQPGTMFVPVTQPPIAVYSAMAEGFIAFGGESGEIQLCGYFRIQDVGGAESLELPQRGDLSLLEALLVGGAPFGLPAVPGVSPDVDVDGDGLERFEVDEEGHITSCIDGDSSVLWGSTCWSDERMADGFSVNLRLAGVSASLGGLEPEWQLRVDGECEGGPPTPSAWDPV
jgi:hypothetical protein